MDVYVKKYLHLTAQNPLYLHMARFAANGEHASNIEISREAPLSSLLCACGCLGHSAAAAKCRGAAAGTRGCRVQRHRDASCTQCPQDASRAGTGAGEKGRRIRELTSVVQKRFKFPDGTVELYAEKARAASSSSALQCSVRLVET